MPQREQIPTTTLEAWGITPGSRVWIGGNNTDARREIEILAGDAQRPPTGEIDRGFIAPLSVEECVYFARKIRPRLAQDGSIWVVYPKRGSGKEADFSGSFENLVVDLFELGFTESGRANLTSDFTSTGFRLEDSQGI
jgi:hypothetical protein